MTAGFRHCRRCDQTKPTSDYSKQPSGQPQQRCKQCIAEVAERTRRQCTHCRESKLRSEFDRTPSGGFRTHCKQCVAEAAVSAPTLLEQIVDLQDGDWQSLGACVGLNPDLFHPAQGEPTHQALAVCEGCQVRLRCLDHALTRPEPYGVWGGKTAAGRDRMRRNRSRQQRGSAA